MGRTSAYIEEKSAWRAAEVAVSLVTTLMKRQELWRGLALFWVAGVSGIVGAGTLATSFRADLVVMIAIAVFAGVAAFSGDRYHRVEGALMLLAYPAAIWVLL